MKIIPHHQIPEVKGFHARSMLMMATIAAIGVAPAVVGHWALGLEATWWMVAPFFCVPLGFLLLMLRRSTKVACPNCLRPMRRQETVLVIEPHKLFGKYHCPPWGIFHCASCDQRWRVPAIKMGKGAHTITEQERQSIEETLET